jgi:hypothetical protein
VKEIKEIFRKTPIMGRLVRKLHQRLFNRLQPFPGSEKYWIHRYDSGGNSGAGSYSKLAEFKAEILNLFVKNNEISNIIEYGCGDGNQLKLAEYPSYIGFDVSPAAIAICNEIFQNDPAKRFKLMSQYDGERAQLALSLDVIYHLIEDDVFHKYMETLFDSSERFVIIYSSNMDDNDNEWNPHVRHRNFAKWVAENRPDWKLARHIPNRFPLRDGGREGSFADFYIYEKA